MGNLCWNHFLIKLQASGLQFYYKDTPAQVFFCEFWKNFKEHPLDDCLSNTVQILLH